MAKRASSTRAPKWSGPTLIQRSRQVPNEQKALYHQVLGAGQRRVRRAFFGLTEADVEVIRQRVGLQIDVRLRRGA